MAEITPAPSPVVFITIGGREVRLRMTKGARYRLGTLPVVPSWDDLCAGGLKMLSALAGIIWASQEQDQVLFRNPEEVFVEFTNDNIPAFVQAIVKLYGLTEKPVAQKKRKK
jgi:hypothetical protein